MSDARPLTAEERERCRAEGYARLPERFEPEEWERERDA